MPTNLPPLPHLSPPGHFKSFLLGREADSWRAAAVVKDSVDGLQENITEDVEADASVGLDASEAARATGRDRGVVDVFAWNGEGLAANGHVEVWWGAAAWEGVSALRAVEAGALDLAVVRLHCAAWEVEERSASVSNRGAEAAGGCVAATCREAASGELPEALRVVNWNVGDAAGVFGAIDVAGIYVSGRNNVEFDFSLNLPKGVAAGGACLQIGSEETLGKSAFDGIVEGCLLLWLDLVDAAESKTKKTIIVRVRDEG